MKAFTAYLGEDRDIWHPHDIRELIRDGHQQTEILIDQGTAAPFLKAELKPELLRNACAAVRQPLNLHMRDGYDHSYDFIASFVADHIAHDAKALT